MVDPTTERHINSPDSPQIRSQRLTLEYERLNRLKTIHIERREFESILNIPVYLYGYITELTKVNLETETVGCKFNLYATIFNNLNEDHVAQLISHRINVLESTNGYELKEEHRKLQEYISNNLIIECGQLTIDIVNEQRIQSQSDSDEEQEDQESDDFYYREVLTNSKITRTYHIHGTFECGLQKNNDFFPYHTLSSSFRLRVQKQYYDDIILKYNLLMFGDDITDQYSQFGFRFQRQKYRKFGIYHVNLRTQTHELKNIEKKMDLLHYDFKRHRETYDPNRDFVKVTKYLQFTFELYSFNVPFVLRNLIPLLVLCFLSLINYFHDTDVYGNVIMLAITLIELLSNFRRSKYTNSTANLFQFNIFGIIVINFLLLVEATMNIYNGRDGIFRVNASGFIFWFSVGLASLLLIINIVTQIYFAIKVERMPKIKDAKDSRQSWMWNQEAVSHVVSELEEHCSTQELNWIF